MWLIACSPGDVAALWVARRLGARELAPVEVVSVEALAYSQSIEHRLGSDGASVRIRLADGRQVAGERVDGLLNRIAQLPFEHLEVAAEDEHTYAMQEISALFLSWLAAMPGTVLNRPVPFGLSGPILDQPQWLALAGRAGLATPVLRIPSPRRNGMPRAGFSRPACNVLVACGALYGAPLGDPEAKACLRLAELSGTDILGIELHRDATGKWEFAGATPHPDLRLGGEPLVDRLAATLADGAAA